MLNIPDTRLANQRISQTRFKDPAEVVAWLGAMQGQDYPGVLWSIGLRLPHSTTASVEQALTDKRIVRTWIMRGTLHLVTAQDIRWMVGLVATKIISGAAARYRELELDAETVNRSNDILAKAVQDGQLLDRPALLALLEQNGISTAGQRAPHLLQRAAYAGLICQTTTNKHPTYTALNDDFPTSTMTREEAVVELARRYFMSRGPVTMQDFVHWSGLTISEARMALDALKANLVSETLNDQTYWRPSTTPPVAKDAPTLYLLPGFDEYLLGYRDRSAILDAEFAERVCPGKNGVFMPTIVSQGRVVGTWKRTQKKDTIITTAQPFTRLSDAEKHAFATASQPYGAFVGVSMVMPES